MYSPDARAGAAGHGQASPGRRFALKAATDTAHEHVESIIRSGGMFDTADGYRRYLKASWLLRRQHEDLMDISGAETAWPDWTRRRIADLVAQDLRDLGQTLPASPEKLTKPLSHAELLGTLYVLEGSSLGARVLVRSVAELGFTSEYGARHLHAQAGDFAAWRSFVAMLESAPVAPSHAAARDAFHRFAAAYRQAAG